MRKLVIAAALLAAMPLAAQQPKPEPVPQAPTLEKPQMAPETQETKPVAKPKPAAAKPSSGEGKVVEEIIARVNNEIITKSEYDKALATAAEEVRQDCQGDRKSVV